MAKVPTLPPIPSWVYFWPTSDLFHDMQNMPKSPAFQRVWQSRRDEFPKSPAEATERVKAYIASQYAAPQEVYTIAQKAPSAVSLIILGYLHLALACATPAAFQLVPPQCSGWGMVATATLTTYTLFFLGAMHIVAYFRKP